MNLDDFYKANLNTSSISQLFGETKKSGKELKATCGCCGGKNLSINLQEPKLNCFNCGVSGDWVEYIKVKEKIGFRDAVVYLHNQLGLEPPDFPASSGASNKNSPERKKLKDCYKEVQVCLNNSVGEAKSYLASRGIEIYDAKGMGLGYCYYSNLHNINKILKSYGLEPWGEKYCDRLSIPLSNSQGLQAWTFRATGDNPIKYLNLEGFNKKDFLQGSFNKTTVVVEGYIDACRLNYLAKGTKVSYIALGGAIATDDHLDILQSAARDKKIEKLVINLDADKAGFDGTLKIIKPLLKSEKVFVLPGELLHPVKDPDQWIAENGYESYMGILDSPEVLYSAKNYLVFVYSNWIKNAPETVKSNILLDAFAAGLTPAELGEGEKEYANYLQSLEQKRLQDWVEALKQKILRGEQLPDPISPPSLSGANTSLFTLEIFDFDSYQESDPIFLHMNDPGVSYSFDDDIFLVESSLNVIAARPGGCKTSSMLNILANQLRFGDRNVAFLSYEEPVHILYKKLLMIVSCHEMDTKSNSKAFGRYLKTRHERSRVLEIEPSITRLNDWQKGDRLTIQEVSGEQLDVLCNRIRFLKDKGYNLFVLDYLQQIRIDGDKDWLGIKKISNQLRELCLEIQCPIIVGSQLNRSKDNNSKPSLSGLREGGDIEQDAHLVLGLWNHELGEKRQNLVWSILKNRNGSTGSDYSFDFHGPTLTIRFLQAGLEESKESNDKESTQGKSKK